MKEKMKKIVLQSKPDECDEPTVSQSTTVPRKKKIKNGKLKSSPSKDTSQNSRNPVDFYSSIFPDASSEEDDDNSTIGSEKVTRNVSYADEATKFRQQPNGSLKRELIGGSSIPSNTKTKQSNGADTKNFKAVLNNTTVPSKKDGIKKSNSSAVQLQTSEPRFSVIVDSSSESDEDNGIEYDDDNDDNNRVYNSEPEIIGVSVRANKTDFSRINDVEVKEEALSDEDVKPDVNDSESEQEEEESDEAPEDNSDRTAIRKELSNMTFEELEELKQRIGTKEYFEAMFGNGESKSAKKRKRIVYKRDNKNRPRELPSKLHVPKVREVIHVKKAAQHRDPRFESSCGDLDEKIWEKNYDFLKEIKKDEAKKLEQSLKTENDEERRKEIRKHLTAMKNKEKSEAMKEKELQKRRQEKEENIKRLKEGKNPFFLKKSTRKFVDLAEKYEELKATGRLEKYLKKKRKKNQGRDKKALSMLKH